MIKKLLLALSVLFAAYYLRNCCMKTETEIPKIPEPNWGPLDSAKDSSIRTFKIDIPKDVINDLRERLSRTREPVPALENVGWTYGLSSKYFKNIIDYWTNKYDWYKRQELLNKYPQFITNIQGLDIHFYHVKPSKLQVDGKQLKVLPLLLVHGWPGSIVEFQKIIPILTTPRAGKNFVFEVIAPSLPGYGFSQGAVRPHMGHAQMAVVFKNLMTRLGFDKFYTQGGDWGSAITTDITILFPERVLGAHTNFCGIFRSSNSLFWLLLGSYFPSLVVESEHYSKVYPLSEKWSRLLEESGYFHLQATKPDTIGTALMQSPAALAAYILEKFSTWTNPEYRFREDGGLLEKYTMDELLDNIMIYWVTDSITTSVRLYAESYSSENRAKYDSLTTNVPVACANFPHEVMYSPKSLVETRFKNLIQFNHLPRGGHFAAFEEPKLLADDFWTFVEKVERSSAE